MKTQSTIIKNNNAELRNTLKEIGYKIYPSSDEDYLCCSHGWAMPVVNLDDYKDSIIFEANDYKKFFETAKEFLIIYKNNLY